MPKIISPAQYLAKARAVHDNKYEYVESSFTRSHSPIEARCLVHGAFIQQLSRHLRGAGCPKCIGRDVDWVARFKTVHGDRYDYSRTVYKDYKKKVEIGCPEHGFFMQTPDNHFRGEQGCPACKGARIRASKQLPVAEFVRRATEVHGGRYLYDSVQFTNMLTGVVRIQCPEHGFFEQNPVNHLAGKVGCARCNYSKSNGEAAVHRFVSVFAFAQSRDRTVLKPKELDIYVPSAKLAVEYCGLYHHALKRPSMPSERAAHQYKYIACAAQGIRLLTLYESEWLQRPQVMRRLLRAALGKMRGRLMARKCELRAVEHPEATAFFERYHPQGGGGVGVHYGLYWRERLVACMRFTYGGTDRGAAAQQRVWTLSRFATRVSVVGAASRLFAAFVREYAPKTVKSFSDNRFFDGGVYPKLGFRLDAELPADYQVWSQKLGLRPKAYYQRRHIQQRLLDHGMTEAFDAKTDPRTEEEMTYFMKAGRLYDCGKKRWLWDACTTPAPVI